MPKTVRFTRVVERSGQPEAHALWLPADKDPEFKRAVAAHRVMSVQPRRGKTDLGFVGFDEKRSKGGQFLIFPKSLKPFEGSEIVGIKFDLVAQPKIVPATGDPHEVSAAARKAASAAAKARAARELAETGRAAPESPAAEEEPPTSPTRTALSPRSAPPKKSRRTTSKPEPKPSAPHKSAAPSLRPNAATLIREIRAALKELQRGKTVAAYQRLERAIES